MGVKSDVLFRQLNERLAIQRISLGPSQQTTSQNDLNAPQCISLSDFALGHSPPDMLVEELKIIIRLNAEESNERKQIIDLVLNRRPGKTPSIRRLELSTCNRPS